MAQSNSLTRQVRKQYIEVCGVGHDWDDFARGGEAGAGFEESATVGAWVEVSPNPLAV